MSANPTTEKLNQEKDKDVNNIIRRHAREDFAQILAVKSFYDPESSATLLNALSEEGTLCNLSKKKVRLATILEPQSQLSQISSISQENGKEIVMKRRLLGVSLTGIMDNGITNGGSGGLDKRLRDLRDETVKTNQEWLKNSESQILLRLLVSNQSGTVSQLVDSLLLYPCTTIPTI